MSLHTEVNDLSRVYKMLDEYRKEIIKNTEETLRVKSSPRRVATLSKFSSKSKSKGAPLNF